jgi:4-amino-4-deoxy-L-arabinose transferase-like glycosyltransferase
MSTEPRQATVERAPWPLLSAALCAGVLLCGLGGYPLMDPDESRCGEIAREMLARHDWVALTLNYVPYFEKPPLMYWLVAASMSVLGPCELAVRMVPALLAVAGMGVAWWLASLTVGRPAARWAPAVLATTACVFAVARVPIVDMLFSVTFAAALTAWLASSLAATRRAGLGLAAVAGCALGLAVLSKGPVAVVLAVGVLVGERLLGLVRRHERLPAGDVGLRLCLAAVAAAAIAAPWFLAAQARNPEFAYYYFVVGHLQRYTGSGKAEHEQPLLYYLAVVPAGFVPWSALWLTAGWRVIRRSGGAVGRPEAGRAGPFLAAWALVVPAFFSLSACKLPQYALPAFWPLAAWTAGLLCAQPEGRRRWSVPLLVAGVVLPLLAVALRLVVGRHPPRGLADIGPALVAVLCAWLLAGALCVAGAALRAGDARRGVLVAAALAALVGPIPGYRAFAGSSDVGPLLPPALRPARAEAGWTIAQFRCSSPALSFYTGSRAVSVDTADLRGIGPTMGDAAEWFPTGEETIDRLSARGPLALVTPARIAEEVAGRHGLAVWATSSTNALLLNPPAAELCR